MFNLRVLIEAGFGALRLPPDVFWDCTPAEILALTGQARKADSMTRGGLEALMAAYPDSNEGIKDE